MKWLVDVVTVPFLAVASISMSWPGKPIGDCLRFAVGFDSRRVWLGARLLNRIDRRIAKTLVAVLVLAAGIHLLVG